MDQYVKRPGRDPRSGKGKAFEKGCCTQESLEQVVHQSVCETRHRHRCATDRRGSVLSPQKRSDG